MGGLVLGGRWGAGQLTNFVRVVAKATSWSSRGFFACLHPLIDLSCFLQTRLARATLVSVTILPKNSGYLDPLEVTIIPKPYYLLYTHIMAT